MNKQLTMKVTILNIVDDTFIAATQLGGMTVRGQKAKTPLLAAQNLFYKLQQNGDDEAELALQLAIADTTMEAQLAVTAGDDQD